MRKKILLLGVLFPLLVGLVWSAGASYPSWWVDDGVVSAQPPLSSNTTAYNAWMQANYAPATLGQLKYVATKAKAYLDSELGAVGGAGPDVDAMVGNFTTSTPNNYSPINVGQLKYVAKPFYDRLIAVGFNTESNLNFYMSGNASSTAWAYTYPWAATGNATTNGVAANLGQLKLVFSFDLDLTSFTVSANLDANDDGFRDAWEVANFGSLVFLTTSDLDSDEVPDYEAANLSDPSIGTLAVTITYPSNGSSL